MSTLCESCKYKRDVVSGKGSRFLLCELALADDRYPKYPPQPMLRCSGFDRKAGGQIENPPHEADSSRPDAKI